MEKDIKSKQTPIDKIPLQVGSNSGAKSHTIDITFSCRLNSNLIINLNNRIICLWSLKMCSFFNTC